jgi:hypothetical protein
MSPGLAADIAASTSAYDGLAAIIVPGDWTFTIWLFSLESDAAAILNITV